MSNRYFSLCVVIPIFLLNACVATNSYSPSSGSSAENIYDAACLSCHEAINEGQPPIYFELDKSRANVKVISEKIETGGLSMPGFSNITGQQLDKLSQYVLEHSKVQ